MMARIAAAIVIASQLILIWVALAPTGRSAIYFSFVGHPLVVVGCALGLVALTRRLTRERAARQAGEQSSPHSAEAG
jgi:hypothetical protein